MADGKSCQQDSAENRLVYCQHRLAVIMQDLCISTIEYEISDAISTTIATRIVSIMASLSSVLAIRASNCSPTIKAA